MTNAEVAPVVSGDAAARDSLLVRLAILVASEPFLGSELALRGAFALHHLALPRPLRRCASLEYSRCSVGPIGPVLDAFRRVAAGAGLRMRTEVRDRPRIQLASPGTRPLGDTRLRVDIETREMRALRPFVLRPLAVPHGPAPHRANILTYETEDLLGFLLRELYRRSRGRDLFDLWGGLTYLDVDDGLVVAAFDDACALAGLGPIRRGAFVARLHRHLDRRAFTCDLAGLTSGEAVAFEPNAAAALVTERLLDRLSRL